MRTKVTIITPPVCPRCQRSAHPGKTCGQAAGEITPAESLFEAYIAARITRARRTLIAAKAAFLRDPFNEGKRHLITQTEADIRRLKEQLSDPSGADGHATGPTITERATPAFRARQAAQADATYAPCEAAAEPFLHEDAPMSDAVPKRRE
ncbi:MAG: hypothetical protein ACJ8KA_14655 [Sulfurifustis sp.]